MKKFLLTLCCMVLLRVAAPAENYPYRDDALWVSVPDHADWLYQTGEWS